MTPKQIILMTAFIDVLGISIIIPVLPFYVESFGVSAFVVTLLFSVYALCSFVSAPYLGALSDKIGRRPVLLVSIASTAIGWLVFAGAQSILFLFIGRIIDGLAAGNFPIAQSYLTDIAKDEKERTSNLGLIGAIFGVAFVIGPALGGFLEGMSRSLPFWVVGGLAVLNFILASFNLPETHHHRNEEKVISKNPLSPIIGIFKKKTMVSNYLVWFIFGLAVSAQQSVFALYINKAFGYGATAAGVFFTGIGVVMIINQGFLLKRFWLKYFDEMKLAVQMLFVFGIGYIIMTVHNLYVFIFGLLLLTFGQSILRIVLTSVAIAHDLSKRGEILGILASIMSLSMVFGPMFGGALFEVNPIYPFIISAIFSFIGFVVLYSSNKKERLQSAQTSQI